MSWVYDKELTADLSSPEKFFQRDGEMLSSSQGPCGSIRPQHPRREEWYEKGRVLHGMATRELRSRRVMERLDRKDRSRLLDRCKHWFWRRGG